MYGRGIWTAGVNGRTRAAVRSSETVRVPVSHFFSAGIYGQDEWHLIHDRMTVTLGARYDWIRVSSDETLNPEYVIAGGVLQTAPAGQEILWNATSARDGSWSANGGASYALDPGIDLTSLFSTAFRSPSLEERYQYLNLGSIVRVGNPYLRSEKSVSANAGFRLHNDGTQVQADLFFNRLRDLVSYVPGVFEGANAFIEENIGEARLYGCEISVEERLASWNVLKCYAAYVRGEDTFDHANLPQIAPMNGRIESSSVLRSFGTFDIAGTLYAEQKNLAAGEIRTPGYAILDADIVSVPFTIEGFSFTIRAGVQNIFNKLYEDHLSTLRGLIVFEPGRNFFLSTTIAI